MLNRAKITYMCLLTYVIKNKTDQNKIYQEHKNFCYIKKREKSNIRLHDDDDSSWLAIYNDEKRFRGVEPRCRSCVWIEL